MSMIDPDRDPSEAEANEEARLLKAISSPRGIV